MVENVCWIPLIWLAPVACSQRRKSGGGAFEQRVEWKLGRKRKRGRRRGLGEGQMSTVHSTSIFPFSTELEGRKRRIINQRNWKKWGKEGGSEEENTRGFLLARSYLCREEDSRRQKSQDSIHGDNLEVTFPFLKRVFLDRLFLLSGNLRACPGRICRHRFLHRRTPAKERGKGKYIAHFHIF